MLGAAFALIVGRFPTLPLLRRAFAWAREAAPSQPLTSPVYLDYVGANREIIDLSDILSFHDYRPLPALERNIRTLVKHGRPLLCTEFMARPNGCTFPTHLPVFRHEGIGCFCWGLVSGRTQTNRSYRGRPGSPEPVVWFHDVLRPDGTPFDPGEAAALRKLTGADRQGRR
jgi:hypothetical protein